MGMSGDHRKQRLALTREAAAAFVGDLQHIREVLGRAEPSQDELRRLSVTLRRILVERDLTNVAAPRIGRIMLKAPDNKPIIKSNKKLPIAYFGSGGVEVFGILVQCVMVERGAGPRPLPEFHPSHTIELRLDGFLSQPVLCLEGQLVSRARAIEYVANITSGAHSGSLKSAPANKRDAYEILSRVRQVATYSLEGGVTTVTFNEDALKNALTDETVQFRYTPDAIDCVLLELLAAAHYLAVSDDTAKLEQVILEELKDQA